VRTVGTASIIACQAGLAATSSPQIFGSAPSEIASRT